MRRLAAGVFLFAWAIVCAAAPAAPWSGAARLSVATARALAGSGTLDIANESALAATRVQRGRRYALALPGAALVWAPVEAALLPLRRAGLVSSSALAESALAAALAALAGALFCAALLRLGAQPVTALAATAVLLLATPVGLYGRVADGTALATVVLLVAVEQARRLARARSVGAAVALGAAVGALALLDDALLLAGLVTAAWALVRARPGARAALALLAPLLLGLGAATAHRLLIGAPPSDPGDLSEGLFGLLFSTGKSIFLYAPPLLAAPWALVWWWRTRRDDATLVCGVAVALLWSLGRQVEWHGDVAWGPRRLVPLVPIVLAPLALWAETVMRRGARAAVTALVAAGLAVQLLGAAFPAETYLRVATAVKNGSGAAAWFGEAPDQCHFVPQFSPIVGHAWLLSHLMRGDRKLDVDPPWKLIVPQTPKLDEQWSRVRLDWWALGVPRAVAAAALLGWAWLAAVGVWLVRRGLRDTVSSGEPSGARRGVSDEAVPRRTPVQ